MDQPPLDRGRNVSVHTDDSDDSDEEEGEDTLIGAGGRVFDMTFGLRVEPEDREPPRSACGTSHSCLFP